MSDKCKTCPSAGNCSTQPDECGVDPKKALMGSLNKIDNVIVVMSGKGGVGKSSLLALLLPIWPNREKSRNFGCRPGLKYVTRGSAWTRLGLCGLGIIILLSFIVCLYAVEKQELYTFFTPRGQF